MFKKQKNKNKSKKKENTLVIFWWHMIYLLRFMCISVNNQIQGLVKNTEKNHKNCIQKIPSL